MKRPALHPTTEEFKCPDCDKATVKQVIQYRHSGTARTVKYFCNNTIKDNGWGIWLIHSLDPAPGVVEDILVQSNDLRDNGNYLYQFYCEFATNPYIIGDGASTLNCTWAASADQHHWGLKSYKHTITTGGSIAEARLCDNTTTTDMHELKQNLTYELIGYAYVPSAGAPAVGEVEIIFKYYSGGAWTEATASPTGTDAWEKVTTGAVTIPAAATGTQALVRIKSTASNDEYVYWDSFRLKIHGIQNDHQNSLRTGNYGYLLK